MKKYFIPFVIIVLIISLIYLFFTTLKNPLPLLAKFNITTEKPSAITIKKKEKIIKPIFINTMNSKYLNNSQLNLPDNSTNAYHSPVTLQLESTTTTFDFSVFYIPSQSTIIFTGGNKDPVGLILPTQYGSGFVYNIINNSESPINISVYESTTPTPFVASCLNTPSPSEEGYNNDCSFMKSDRQYVSQSINQLSQTSNQTIEQCSNACAMNPECTAYYLSNYDETALTGTCILQSSDPSAAPIKIYCQPDFSSQYFGKYKNPQMAQPGNNCSDTSNVYIYAENKRLLDTIYNISESECSKRCQLDGNCEMYLMGLQENSVSCELFSDVSNVQTFCNEGQCPVPHEKYGKVKTQSILPTKMVLPQTPCYGNTISTYGYLEMSCSTTGCNQIYSPNGKFRMVFQTDCNLVINNENGETVWATGTSGISLEDGETLTVVLLADGNFAMIYNYDPFVYTNYTSFPWSSNTTNSQADTVLLTNNGVLMLINSSSKEKYFESTTGNFSGEGSFNSYGLGTVPDSLIPNKVFIDPSNVTPYRTLTTDYTKCMNICESDGKCQMALASDSNVNNCKLYESYAPSLNTTLSLTNCDSNTYTNYGMIKSNAQPYANMNASMMIPPYNTNDAIEGQFISATGQAINSYDNINLKSCNMACNSNPECEMVLMKGDTNCTTYKNVSDITAFNAPQDDTQEFGTIKARNPSNESFRTRTVKESYVDPSNENVSGSVILPGASLTVPENSIVTLLSLYGGYSLLESSGNSNSTKIISINEISNIPYNVVSTEYQSPLNIVLKSGNTSTRFNFSNVNLPTNSTIFYEESFLNNTFTNVLNLPPMLNSSTLYIYSQNSKNKLNVVYTNGFAYKGQHFDSFIMEMNSFVVLNYTYGSITILYQFNVNFTYQTVRDSDTCNSLNGTNFNYCPELGIYYCCNVCNDVAAPCPSDSSLVNCGCIPFYNYTTVNTPSDVEKYTKKSFMRPTVNTFTAQPPATYNYTNVSFPTQSVFILDKDVIRYDEIGTLHYIGDCYQCYKYGTLHYVENCTECDANQNFCNEASSNIFPINTKDNYTIGLPLSQWGCSNVNEDTIPVRFENETEIYILEPLNWCEKAENKTAYVDFYTVGSSLENWGCDKITDKTQIVYFDTPILNEPNGNIVTGGVFAVEPMEDILSNNNVVNFILPSFGTVNNGTFYMVVNPNPIIYLIVQCPQYTLNDTFQGLINTNSLCLYPNTICSLILLNQSWFLISYTDEMGNSIDSIPPSPPIMSDLINSPTPIPCPTPSPTISPTPSPTPAPYNDGDISLGMTYITPFVTQKLQVDGKIIFLEPPSDISSYEHWTYSYNNGEHTGEFTPPVYYQGQYNQNDVSPTEFMVDNFYFYAILCEVADNTLYLVYNVTSEQRTSFGVYNIVPKVSGDTITNCYSTNSYYTNVIVYAEGISYGDPYTVGALTLYFDSSNNTASAAYNGNTLFQNISTSNDITSLNFYNSYSIPNSNGYYFLIRVNNQTKKVIYYLCNDSYSLVSCNLYANTSCDDEIGNACTTSTSSSDLSDSTNYGEYKREYGDY